MAGLSRVDYRPNITLNNLDKFSYIGGFSGAGMINTNQLDQAYNGVFKDPLLSMRKYMYSLWVSVLKNALNVPEI